MKTLLLIFTLLASSTAFAGDEYEYTCSSDTNNKIFHTGNSQNIVIELNEGNLSINNKSGIWSLLGPKIEEGAMYFVSLPNSTTQGLTAAGDNNLLQGGKKAQLTIFKDINTSKMLIQEYRCVLTGIRH